MVLRDDAYSSLNGLHNGKHLCKLRRHALYVVLEQTPGGVAELRGHLHSPMAVQSGPLTDRWRWVLDVTLRDNKAGCTVVYSGASSPGYGLGIGRQ